MNARAVQEMCRRLCADELREITNNYRTEFMKNAWLRNDPLKGYPFIKQ